MRKGNFWQSWLVLAIHNSHYLLRTITLRQKDANQKRFITFSIVVLCCSMEGELVCKIIKTLLWLRNSLQIFFALSIPSFLHSPSVSLSSCKNWFPGYKSHFCFSASHSDFQFLLFSLIFCFRYIILFSLSLCMCATEREGGFGYIAELTW